MPPQYKLKLEISGHNADYYHQRLSLEEISIKYDILRVHLNELNKKFIQANKKYKTKIKNYIDDNKHEIDLERAKYD